MAVFSDDWWFCFLGRLVGWVGCAFQGLGGFAFGGRRVGWSGGALAGVWWLSCKTLVFSIGLNMLEWPVAAERCKRLCLLQFLFAHDREFDCLAHSCCQWQTLCPSCRHTCETRKKRESRGSTPFQSRVSARRWHGPTSAAAAAVAAAKLLGRPVWLVVLLLFPDSDRNFFVSVFLVLLVS